MTIPLLVDVDTGVDDALALVFLARHPLLELRAVTCVAGNTDVDHVIRNTLDVLHLAGAGQIPVARGAEQPLIETHRPADEVHGEDGLAGLALPTSPHPAVEAHAVELMRQTVINSTEPLTLLALGPLTNVALFIRMYPREAAQLKRIVFMGGSASVGNASAVAEFNVWHDPEATAIVLDAPVPVAMYGLDVFNEVTVAPVDYSKLQASPDAVLRLAGDLLDHSAQVHSGVERLASSGLIGDAGAACFLAVPELVGTKHFPTSVELGAGKSRGQTIVDRRDLPGEAEAYGIEDNHRTIEVAMTVDAHAMARLFLDTIYEGEPR